ncbi:hypothetical protein ACG0Z6_11645 [Roseateles sp. BYS180W]|uniref:Uncharacterized protein n=1 Tax=Roseateles rivi TaxID=3299028 RepID=A0ABW7FX41_9BURK
MAGLGLDADIAIEPRVRDGRRVALLTDASTALGLLLAQHRLARGWWVYAGAPSDAAPQR